MVKNARSHVLLTAKEKEDVAIDVVHMIPPFVIWTSCVGVVKV
jgi:hypothetical protein